MGGVVRCSGIILSKRQSRKGAVMSAWRKRGNATADLFCFHALHLKEVNQSLLDQYPLDTIV